MVAWHFSAWILPQIVTRPVGYGVTDFAPELPFGQSNERRRQRRFLIPYPTGRTSLSAYSRHSSARLPSASPFGTEELRSPPYNAYWASPLPKDQFSFLTSIRLMKTSSRRSPTAA